jgi:hypothetical protein
MERSVYVAAAIFIALVIAVLVIYWFADVPQPIGDV